MLDKMVWKERYGLRNYRQGMTNNLLAYCRSDNLDVGATTDLNGNLGWLKTNGDFGGILEALRREHQGDMTGRGGTDSPTATAVATVMEYSSNVVSDPYLGGREDMRRTKKERKKREDRERTGFGGGG